MTADKEKVKLKAEKQIKGSSFVKVIYDLTFDPIAKKKFWTEKLAGEMERLYIH